MSWLKCFISKYIFRIGNLEVEEWGQDRHLQENGYVRPWLILHQVATHTTSVARPESNFSPRCTQADAKGGTPSPPTSEDLKYQGYLEVGLLLYK